MTKILFITPYPIESASERYRLYQFLPDLERAGFVCEVRPFATPRLFRAVQAEEFPAQILYSPFCVIRRAVDLMKLSGYDLVVIHREAFPFGSPIAENIVLRHHPRVIFSFDDAIHIGHREAGKTKYPGIYRFKYGPGVNEILRGCAHVIAGNRILAEHASQFNSHVTVIPTVVDTKKYPFKPPRSENDVLTIGWVGSRSTSPYLLEIEPALRRLSEEHPWKIRFRLYGHPQRRLNLVNCESLPFSLETEIEDISSLDIGIMPMPDNAWTRAKCAFKAIQYMALGIPTVTSPVGMAQEVVRPNSSGFWARTPNDWFDALNRLVCDAMLRRQFAEEGRKLVEAHYSVQTWAPRYTSLLAEIALGDSAKLSHAETRQIEGWF
ncbi:MAG: glycosyltransferase family 4 protein [Candidatus Acidiferrales bacterium]